MNLDLICFCSWRYYYNDGSIYCKFLFRAKVCHVEAGLRTNNKLSFPRGDKSSNSRKICEYHFAQLKILSATIKENIPNNSILVTGNTVIDSLLKSVERVNEKQ